MAARDAQALSATLLIECGNTRCKWARWDARGVQPLGAMAYAELSSAEQLAGEWAGVRDIERVMIASVSRQPLVEEAVKQLGKSELPIQVLATRQDCAGLHLAYPNPESLGVDRWLAMLAAIDQCEQPVCVVDCGTAMTLDVVAAGKHLGGQILPGLELMRDSLHHGTSLLPKPEGRGQQAVLGRDTETCILAGTRAALAGAVNLVMQELASLGAIRGIITGGNARDVLPLLHGEWELRPHLVLEGMAVIGRKEEMGDGL